MNPQIFLTKVKQAFSKNDQNLEDSFANDEFLQKCLWARLDNSQFSIRKGQKVELQPSTQISHFKFSKNLELEIYKIITLNEFEFDEGLIEIAKTFYDIENRSYSFRFVSHPLEIFSKFIQGLDLENDQRDLRGENIQNILEIYDGEDNALFLSLGEDVLFVYLFTFCPCDEFLN